MSYNTHWIEKYIGITRKTLLTYEKKGFVKPERNSVTDFREYSDEDLMRIWQIKLLVELKYSFKEITELILDEDTPIRDSIDKKIKKLEKEKEKIEQLIGVARMIKVTGRMPTIKMDRLGETVFEDFLQFVKANWNVNVDPKVSEYAALIERLSEKPQSEWTEDEMLQFMQHMDETQIEMSLSIHKYCTAILESESLGITDLFIQDLVEQLYECFGEFYAEQGVKLSPIKFWDLFGNALIDGSSALMFEQQWSYVKI